MRAQTTQVGDLAVRAAVKVDRDTTAADCARIMHSEHVGSVIVTDGAGGKGLVTDRDIVIEVVATGLDPATLTAGDMMAPPLATVRESDDLLAALARMREQGVRRLGVVDDEARLTSVLAVDNRL
ncbi:MAG: CBS domain-containing protein [Sutterellaceae bacterium]|nr:CBS domain-containing protein [Burkholderiaceae bacterium]MCX7901634.1 CBS domain-containing protein [Burkholderiaceae bacterium]MDW8430920.1 CBS domain-containing protein [Sutterellaceae bacterium]